MISGLMNRSVIASSAVGVVAPIIGNSDWESVLGEVTNFTKIGGDKHYFTTIPSFTSIAQVGKTWSPTRTNQSFLLGQAECDVYTITSTWSVDAITQARMDQVLANTGAGGNTVSYLQALAKQGIGQRLRNIGLFGLEAGEGIISASTEIDLGNDPAGNTKLSQMNADWLGKQLASLISQIDSAMLNTPSEIVILTSNRVYNLLNYARTQTAESIFNGSVVSIADYLKKVVEGTGRKLTIGKDPTLENANAGTKDIILIVAPGISEEASREKASVNQFGLEVKTIDYNTCLDMGEYQEKIYPESYMGVNGDIKCSCTAGIVLRDNISLAVSAQF